MLTTSKIKEIRAFVEDLARVPATPDSVNQFSYDHDDNEIRRNNLVAYFSALAETSPTVLLIGEAPGYRGSRRTGVPFSSEKIMLTHPFFTSRKDFKIANTDNPYAESSASIVWKTMDELSFYPFIWAAFPFHPHHAGNDQTNRAPTKEEIALGKEFVMRLMKIFDITDVVAIGRVAEKTLVDLEIPATHVRHPSHGGANLFRAGLADFIKK